VDVAWCLPSTGGRCKIVSQIIYVFFLSDSQCHLICIVQQMFKSFRGSKTAATRHTVPRKGDNFVKCYSKEALINFAHEKRALPRREKERKKKKAASRAANESRHETDDSSSDEEVLPQKRNEKGKSSASSQKSGLSATSSMVNQPEASTSRLPETQPSPFDKLANFPEPIAETEAPKKQRREPGRVAQNR
jgi:hypothetical protein